MEALSPRSTNILPKPKPASPKKDTIRHAPAQQQKPVPSKYHASPPPSLVREPGDNGEQYVTGNFLGKGGFAICYEGRLARNDRLFAMKVVKSEMPQKKMAEKFRTELQIHSKMRHPNIVGFHRAFAFENSTYVILELCPYGSIMEMVRKRKCLSLPEVRRFTVQLCGAIKYLHKRNVAHRDLKMGNLFLDRNMNIKVGDFGLAAIMLSEKDERRRKTLCGTPNYIAPEVLDKGKGGHNQKVDIWSLGVILFAMLTGYPPFQSKTQDEIYKKVRSISYNWPTDSECANYIPIEAKNLVGACLSLEEQERPEPDQIVDHAFFNMYPGCIPRQLDPELRTSKPVWIKPQDPRGDRMILGYSLDYDSRYREKLSSIANPEQRYTICKDQFYTECGVGKMASGVMRKTVGKSRSKSAFAECALEEERGLQPVIPLPSDRVYTNYIEIDHDWSTEGPDSDAQDDSKDSIEDDILPRTRSASQKIQAATRARTQMALDAQLRRKDTQPQSHAARLRQQALPSRHSTRSQHSVQLRPDALDKPFDGADGRVDTHSQRPLGERPIRSKSRSGSVQISSVDTARVRSEPVRPTIPKSTSVPASLTTGKTRSQSRQQRAESVYDIAKLAKGKPEPAGPVKLDKIEDAYSSVRSMPVRTVKIDSREQEKAQSWEDTASHPAEEKYRGSSHSSSTDSSGKGTTTSKSRSALGLSGLIHPEEHAEILRGTHVREVMSDLKAYLGDINRSRSSSYGSTRHLQQQASTQQSPHAYVVKWVDYTNRYGIGYVLDDGSVGCIFRAENGRPASCVVVRDGERHIRRKAKAKGSSDPLNAYSENDQLVPRNGQDVEFYESIDTDPSLRYGGVMQRALVQPSVFEVKKLGSSGGVGVRVRSDVGPECAKCDAEKVKRVKLVDQFGKYMIGSLGRGNNDDITAEVDASPQRSTHGTYIKFYQRLGNVGIWGFGDGAFQFNFPDHTKLVISLSKSASSSPSCQVDFYHLSPSAARYLAAKGKMHPAGFDSRAVMSDEIGIFFALLSGGYSHTSGSTNARLREILEVNAFPRKMEFIRDVLQSWLRSRRLGAKILSISGGGLSGENANSTDEVFWDGVQEKQWNGPGGSKFVWVTVGAQGGDGEYVSVSLKKLKDGEPDIVGAPEEMKTKLSAMMA